MALTDTARHQTRQLLARAAVALAAASEAVDDGDLAEAMDALIDGLLPALEAGGIIVRSAAATARAPRGGAS